MSTDPAPDQAPSTPDQAPPAPADQQPAAPADQQIAAAPGEVQSTPDERQMAFIAHMGGMIPYIGFAVPLGLWAAKMGESPFIEDQAKEALNLQINVLMITVLCTITCMFYVGYALLPAALIINAIFCFQGGSAAKEGKIWRYPYNIRYIN